VLFRSTCVFDIDRRRLIEKTEKGRAWADIRRDVTTASGEDGGPKRTEPVHQDFNWTWQSEMKLSGVRRRESVPAPSPAPLPIPSLTPPLPPPPPPPPAAPPEEAPVQ
jgi:hypothetical protein